MTKTRINRHSSTMLVVIPSLIVAVSIVLLAMPAPLRRLLISLTDAVREQAQSNGAPDAIVRLLTPSDRFVRGLRIVSVLYAAVGVAAIVYVLK